MEWRELRTRFVESLGFGAVQKDGREGLVRKTWWLVLLGILGCLLVVTGEVTAPPARPRTEQDQPAAAKPGGGEATPAEYAAGLEQGLTETLGQIVGAGEVRVRVYLESGPRFEYARKTSSNARTTEERDRTGGLRTITEREDGQEVTVVRNDGAKKEEPVILVRHEPEIRGVLVLATGAADVRVREALAAAVQTALGLPAHRVEVLAREVR